MKKNNLLFALFVAIILSASVNAQDISVTLTWTAPGDDGSVGQAAEYDIRYSTDSITVDNWDACTQIDSEPPPLPAGSAESFTVGGLESNTTYFFAVKTVDEAGNWSELSNIAQVTTSDNIPPAAINDLEVVENGAGVSSVTLQPHTMENE